MKTLAATVLLEGLQTPVCFRLPPFSRAVSSAKPASDSLSRLSSTQVSLQPLFSLGDTIGDRQIPRSPHTLRSPSQSPIYFFLAVCISIQNYTESLLRSLSSVSPTAMSTPYSAYLQIHPSAQNSVIHTRCVMVVL